MTPMLVSSPIVRLLVMCGVLMMMWAIGLPKAQAQSATDRLLLRAVNARLYHLDRWLIERETADSVGKYLAQLKPSYVSNLLLVNPDKPFSEAQVQAYQRVRATVRAAVPECKFDVAINPIDFASPDAFAAKLAEVHTALSPDGIFLEYSSAKSRNKSRPAEIARAFAQQHNLFLGVNEPDNAVADVADFIVLHDGYGIELKMRDQIAALRDKFQKPIAIQINSLSERTDSDNIHTYLRKWKTFEREALIKRLARNQSTWKYRFIYPVYYPVLMGQVAHNAPKDGKLLAVILEQMKLYNSK